MDLFEAERSKKTHPEPLAVRMRPASLAEFSGQAHILAPGKLLRRAIESDKISSIVLYGPPGTGKTTLASVISNETKSHFEPMNAVTSNVADIRKVIDQAKKRYQVKSQKTILFIDEIHRFNKAQQDVLMPDVERGNPVLVGATTHNPFFSIVPALLSRSLVFELKPLTAAEVRLILERALKDEKNGLGKYGADADEEALEFLSKVSDGDARRALNALELAVLTTPPVPSFNSPLDPPSLIKEGGTGGVIHITKKIAEESIQKKAVVYDADEDAHYDTISAFIKIDARLRSGRGALLSGEDALCRRGPALRRAPYRDLRLRGRRERRPAGAGRGQRCLSGVRIHRHARSAHPAGAGDGLRRLRAQVQRQLHGHRERDEGRGRGPDAGSAQALERHPL